MLAARKPHSNVGDSSNAEVRFGPEQLEESKKHKTEMNLLNKGCSLDIQRTSHYSLIHFTEAAAYLVLRGALSLFDIISVVQERVTTPFCKKLH